MRRILKPIWFITIVLAALTFCRSASAVEFAEGRAFISGIGFIPEQLNTYNQSQGLDEMKSVLGVGIEADARIFANFLLGLRIEHFASRVGETAKPSANPNNPYFSSFSQTSASIVARVDVIKTDHFVVDVFGSLGNGSPRIDIRTAAGEGTLERDTSKSENTFISRYGATAGFGWSQIYLYVEAGAQNEKIDSLRASGYVPQSVKEIDFSGTYYTLGILFTGDAFKSRQKSSDSKK
jgi:hypothetical protein